MWLSQVEFEPDKYYLWIFMLIVPTLLFYKSVFDFIAVTYG